jgi:hypothetical protein
MLDTPIARDNLRRCLVSIFYGHGMDHKRLSLYKDVFVKTCIDFKTSNNQSFASLVFGRKNKKTVMGEVKILVLKLFCCHFLVPNPVETELYVALALHDDGNPKLNIDEMWKGFNYI